MLPEIKALTTLKLAQSLRAADLLVSIALRVFILGDLEALLQAG
jgi:hypothetical protein